ncbi:hypothetical protein MUK42_37290 [Musa troglodytarum]|uniref:Uncharacterized protein n=1 Tax=Musa troglodytarum TaxID=320322 RepID=A0A9E7HM44_9LILI|nr:hypothetical protein MUK42_37290 [Musa troglodytarum]
MINSLTPPPRTRSGCRREAGRRLLHALLVFDDLGQRQLLFISSYAAKESGPHGHEAGPRDG